MNVLIILAHPEPRSFNGGLVDTAVARLKRAGHSVDVNDLYAERFDPLEQADHYSQRADQDYFAPLDEQRHHHEKAALPADIQRELARLEWADLVIFQFPLWWHAQPAVLKGWFDRVLVYGGRYTSRMRYDQGYFKGKRTMLSVTAGSPEAAFQPFGRAGNMVAWLWPIHSSLYYVGFDVLAPQVSYGVQGGGIEYKKEDALRKHLNVCKLRWAERLMHWEREKPIPFAGWEDWDSEGMLLATSPWRWRLG
ncbi:NAD(P)H-dependent oxidoreductase [Vreelandella populi]|uniref:Flavodoxin family protein n=1 Tax=Vreelandella populi TaxID=2498858 RepID=A0A433LGB7_9GAMM|nr:NAD(P)H-dependent oxidoreductase [Halomonas populi]RUR37927.1 flavodoxin family protein [Halomonas populi]RUR48905.1 flavodoxin family protein [Halomonas populi]RUR55249.1 flavodoxin family protein [Halomonas populi]